MDKRVMQVRTTSKKERTANGIGPGVSVASLRRVFTKCRNPELSYCRLGSTKRTGDRYTHFAIEDGRIAWVAVGRWHDYYDCWIGCD